DRSGTSRWHQPTRSSSARSAGLGRCSNPAGRLTLTRAVAGTRPAPVPARARPGRDTTGFSPYGSRHWLADPVKTFLVSEALDLVDVQHDDPPNAPPPPSL